MHVCPALNHLPLALYPFSNDRATVERIVDANLAGGVAVNDTLVHFAVDTLPFGGIGPSGMGQYHGFEGFLEFSKLRPVFTNPRLSLLSLFYPPYKPRHRRILDVMLRFGR